MYLDEPYDESEETPDAVLLQDQDGNIIKSSERRDENEVKEFQMEKID
jgi:hypothetical protein